MNARKLRGHSSLRASFVAWAGGSWSGWQLASASSLAWQRGGISVWLYLVFCIPAFLQLADMRGVRVAAQRGHPRSWIRLYAGSAA